MKVLLIPLGVNRIPNLALLKLARWHRSMGDEVSADEPEPDRVYVSSPFSIYNNHIDYSKRFPGAEIEYGGYGLSRRMLPENVEHLMPDYSFIPELAKLVRDPDVRKEYYSGDYSIGYTCYDEHTEVLTVDGWKHFKDLEYSDKVATLNDMSGELEYQNPIEIVQEQYVGKLLHFENLYIDLLVTPNHKMYIKKHAHTDFYKRKDETRNERRFELIPAEEAAKFYQIIFKKDAIWNGVEQPLFKLPEIKTKNGIHKQYVHDMDDWLEFLGYYLSEGSTQKKRTRNYIVKISQSHHVNPETSIKIENCIKRLGYSYYKHPKDGFSISNKQVYEYLKPLGTSHNKHIPAEFKQLSRRQLEIFFDAFITGDGHIYTTKNKFKMSVAVTSSKKMAGDLQEIMLKLGCCGDIKIHTKKGEGHLFKKENRIIYATDNIYRITTNNHYSNPIFSKQNRQVREVEHSGLVYCCIVPNHIIYVRRNGKAVWCGNTRGCIRHCVKPPCIVPEYEGMFRRHAHVSEFHCPDHKKIMLMDNNILADREWFKTNAQYIIENGLRMMDQSGFDIRLVDREIAELLSHIKFYKRMIHLALDSIHYIPEFVKNTGTLLEYRKARNITVYLYEKDNLADLIQRFDTVKELGCQPFVMPDVRAADEVRRFARYANKSVYKVCPWEDYQARGWKCGRKD